MAVGDYAVLDAVPGGVFHLDINGVPVRGRYVELDPPHRLLISWGHAGSDRLPPGSKAGSGNLCWDVHNRVTAPTRGRAPALGAGYGRTTR